MGSIGVVHAEKQAVTVKQIIEGALLGDFAMIHDQDPICSGNGFEPVRHRDGAAPDSTQVPVDNSLRLLIQCRRCFIQDEETRVSQQGSRDGDPLPLAPPTGSVRRSSGKC